MKKILIFIAFILFLAFNLTAQNIYKVNRNDSKVYQERYESSMVIGFLKEGQQIEVSNINGQWGTIRYKNNKAYIHVQDVTFYKHCKHKDNVQSSQTANTKQASATYIDSSSSKIMWLIPVIILLMVAHIRTRNNLAHATRDETIFYLESFIFFTILLTGLELFFLTNAPHLSLFIENSHYLLKILFFLLYGIFAYLQLFQNLCYIRISSNNSWFGYYSWPFFFIGYFTLTFLNLSTDCAVYFIVAAQAVQVIIILIENSLYKFIFALFLSVGYILFAITTVMILFENQAIGIIVIVIYTIQHVRFLIKDSFNHL